MGLFQKFKEVFQSKKQREKELEEILEEENVVVEENDEEEQALEEIVLEENAASDENFEDAVLETQLEETNEETLKETEVLSKQVEEVEIKEEKIESVPKAKKKKPFFKLTEKDKDLVTYDKGLEKTRKEFVSELSLLGKKFTKVTEEYYEELESLLIKADVGVNTVFKFVDRLRNRVKHENITDTSFLTEVIVDELFMIYVEGESLTDKINISSEGPTVILMVGVNGVGKTTTIGKLANKMKESAWSYSRDYYDIHRVAEQHIMLFKELVNISQ